MSGIAEVLLNLGYPVSGSDLAASDDHRAARAGAPRSSSVTTPRTRGREVVVISSAVKPQPGGRSRRELELPVIPRAEMLAELMRMKTGIAVAGTHGKTTTTSMVAALLATPGLDPTVVIGGMVDASARTRGSARAT